MTLNTLSVFLTLVEEMNFTRAAQRLFITQQSLSGHIKRLEEEYGVTLFERRPSLKLTAEGESMVFYANQILLAENAMISSFADLTSRSTAYLDLGISYMRSTMLGAGLWKRFHTIHPNIQVRLFEANTSALLDRLQHGEIFLMVGVDIRPVPGIRVIPLMKEYLCCVIDRDLYAEYFSEESREEGAVRGEELSVTRLRDIPMMFPTKGNRLRISLERMFRNAGFLPRILLESERQDVLFQLAENGEGAAILSPMVLYDRKTGGLAVPETCHVFRVAEAGASTISVAVPADFSLPHYAQTMIDVIRDVFEDYAKAIGEIGLREE